MNEIETFHGLIEDTSDALRIFQLCRLGRLGRIRRRLHEKERKLIRSASVFVFDEQESGIRRWTDGRLWSPSRILGNFLIYRELERKAEGAIDGGDGRILPASEVALQPSSQAKGCYGAACDPTAFFFYDHPPPQQAGRTEAALASPPNHHGQQPPACNGVPPPSVIDYGSVTFGVNAIAPSGERCTTSLLGPNASRLLASKKLLKAKRGAPYSFKDGTEAAPPPQTNGHGGAVTNGRPVGAGDAYEDVPLAGAKDAPAGPSRYAFKPDGLIKKTISARIDGRTQHLVCYFDEGDFIRTHSKRTLLVSPAQPEVAPPPNGSLSVAASGDAMLLVAAAAGDAKKAASVALMEEMRKTAIPPDLTMQQNFRKPPLGSASSFFAGTDDMHGYRNGSQAAVPALIGRHRKRIYPSSSSRAPHLSPAALPGGAPLRGAPHNAFACDDSTATIALPSTLALPSDWYGLPMPPQATDDTRLRQPGDALQRTGGTSDAYQLAIDAFTPPASSNSFDEDGDSGRYRHKAATTYCPEASLTALTCSDGEPFDRFLSSDSLVSAPQDCSPHRPLALLLKDPGGAHEGGAAEVACDGPPPHAQTTAIHLTRDEDPPLPILDRSQSPSIIIS